MRGAAGGYYVPAPTMPIVRGATTTTATSRTPGTAPALTAMGGGGPTLLNGGIIDGHIVHVDPSYGVVCACPSCRLGTFMSSLYSTQQKASPAVMAEYPSPTHPDPIAASRDHEAQLRSAHMQLQGVARAQQSVVDAHVAHVLHKQQSTTGAPIIRDVRGDGEEFDIVDPSTTVTTAAQAHSNGEAGGSAPSASHARAAHPHVGMDPKTGGLIAPATCPMYAAFGFCTYGRTCLLPHDDALVPAGYPLVPPPRSLEEAMARLEQCAANVAAPSSRCDVCGAAGSDESSVAKVGEMYTFRFCRLCATPAYFPHVLHALELLIAAAGDDYHVYKDGVELMRYSVPAPLKIPIAYEAHRVATAVYAWSLVSPTDAAAAMTAAMAACPGLTQVVSVGSGTGYTEHVFNRVVNGAPAKPGPPTLGPSSYFDGVRAPLPPAEYAAALRQSGAGTLTAGAALFAGLLGGPSTTAAVTSTANGTPQGPIASHPLAAAAVSSALRRLPHAQGTDAQDEDGNPQQQNGGAALTQKRPLPHAQGTDAQDEDGNPQQQNGGAALTQKRPLLHFYAFDEIIRPVQFSVRVSVGGPASVLSLDCATACLLMCWPPFGSPQEEQSSMGFEALRHFHRAGGSVVIYIGDQASTGDWRFHEYLFCHYVPVPDYTTRKELRRWNPHEMGLVYAGNDTLGVYERRREPLQTHWSWQRM